MHPQAHNKALIAALVRLEQVGVPDEEKTKPTMQDLREALPNMNDREFQITMKNLRRRGKVRMATTIAVPYCTRKVAVYDLWVGDVPKTAEQHQESLALWASMPASIEPIAETA
jgi:hypothetical protein